MKLSEEQQAERVIATRGAAAAFVEDIHHLRDVLADTDARRGEIRRLSVILRRLLVDGELELIAGPRIGKVLVTSPQNKRIYRDAGFDNGMWLSGGARIFGFAFRNVGTYEADTDPDETVLLKVKDFLNQAVIYFEQTWVKRKSVITYVANKGSAAHTGKIIETDHHLLEAFQRKIFIGKKDRTTRISVNFHRGEFLDVDVSKMELTAEAVDGIFLELLSAAAYLVDSPDIMKLEAAIITEVGLKL